MTGPFIHSLCAALRFSGGVLDQQLDQLVLEILGELEHFLDDLAGQVVEVLGHHDVGQQRLGGPRIVLRPIEERAGLGRHPLEIVHAQPAAVQLAPLPAQARAFLFHALLDLLAFLDIGQGALGGLAGQPRDVIQALARIGQRVHGLLHFLVVAQLAQRIVQLPGQHADPLVELRRLIGRGLVLAHGGRRGRSRVGCRFGIEPSQGFGRNLVEQRFEVFGIAGMGHYVLPFIFCTILVSFSSSVALVKGLTM